MPAGDASSRRLYVVALGDLAAFAVFGVIGMVSHAEGVSVETFVRASALFIATWFVLAPFLGALPFHGEPESPSLVRVAAAWPVVGVIALVGRAIVFDRELFTGFFGIALVGNGLFLVGWRAAYRRWFGRSSRATMQP